MSLCPSHNAQTVRQIDFKLGRFVADGPKMCICASGAVWTSEVFDIDKNLGKFMLTAFSSALLSDVTNGHCTSRQQNLKLWF